jgi:uncharacterized membrane protein (DUF4010 family)
VDWLKLPTNLPLIEFGIALLIGALVGIDRERKKAAEGAEDVGGLRTFILLAEAGAISAWLAVELEAVWIFAVTAAVVGALVIAGYYSVARKRDESFGLTTEVAAVVVFLLGGLVVVGYRDLAVVLAIATSALLAYKAPLHGMVAKLSQEDVYAGLKLLIATFIVLPVLPNEPLDPWGALNPYRMWWLVILISSLSLAGYVASRWLGTEYGTALTGLFGGLASSTAVTLALARQSSEPRQRALAAALAAGLLLSWMVMFVRIAVEVAVVNAALLPAVVVPISVMGLTVAAMAAIFYVVGRRSRQAAEEVPLENPFSLTSALRFAAVFTAVQLVVKLVETYSPGESFYVVAALAGLTDVDAITLSMADYARDGDARIAAASIVIAALTNTLVKCGLVLALGARGLGLRIAAATGIILAMGIVSLFVPPPPVAIPPAASSTENRQPASEDKNRKDTKSTK